MRLVGLGIPLLIVGVALAAEFEVASVKSAAPQTGDGVFVGIRGGPGTNDSNRMSYVNESLRNLLSEAYSVKLYQVFGPEWIDTERYDIVATLAPNSTRDQSRGMLQNLLTSRFQTVIHHEQREFPGFELSVAKSGSKLTPSAATSNPGIIMQTKNGVGHLIVTRETIAAVAKVLEGEVGTPIVDKTRITGTFDFTLEFVRDRGRIVNQSTGIPQSTPVADSAVGDGPALSTALLEQLGLKLDRAKVPLDAIILDRTGKMPVGN